MLGSIVKMCSTKVGTRTNSREGLCRSSINARWPKNKILLSVTIELLRHHLATSPDMSETEDHVISETEDHVISETDDLIMSETQEIEWICTFDSYHIHAVNV